MKYGKLVRDKIPDIIEAKGEVPIYHILDNEKMKKHLFIKLMEEYKEMIEAYSEYQMYVKHGYEDPKHLIEEIGDVLEVIMSLGKIDDIEEQELLYLGRLAEPTIKEDLTACFAKLKRTVCHIYNIRQIHKQDYITLMQLLLFLIRTLKFQEQEILKFMLQKREERGRFDKRIYLENVVQKQYTK